RKPRQFFTAASAATTTSRLAKNWEKLSPSAKTSRNRNLGQFSCGAWRSLSVCLIEGARLLRPPLSGGRVFCIPDGVAGRAALFPSVIPPVLFRSQGHDTPVPTPVGIVPVLPPSEAPEVRLKSARF